MEYFPEQSQYSERSRRKETRNALLPGNGISQILCASALEELGTMFGSVKWDEALRNMIGSIADRKLFSLFRSCN